MISGQQSIIFWKQKLRLTFFYQFRISTDQKGLVMLPLLYYPASLFVSILPLANTFSLLLPVNYMALCVSAFTAYTRTQWSNLTFLGYVYIFFKIIEHWKWLHASSKSATVGHSRESITVLGSNCMRYSKRLKFRHPKIW